MKILKRVSGVVRKLLNLELIGQSSEETERYIVGEFRLSKSLPVDVSMRLITFARNATESNYCHHSLDRVGTSGATRQLQCADRLVLVKSRF